MTDIQRHVTQLSISSAIHEVDDNDIKPTEHIVKSPLKLKVCSESSAKA
jgi:hypothetical protein